MRLRYLTSAYHDLRLIFEYIARENPTAARRVITALRKEAQTLTEHPHIGRPGQVEGTREQVHGHYPYIIAFRIKNDEYRYSASFTVRVNGRKIFDFAVL